MDSGYFSFGNVAPQTRHFSTSGSRSLQLHCPCGCQGFPFSRQLGQGVNLGSPGVVSGSIVARYSSVIAAACFSALLVTFSTYSRAHSYFSAFALARASSSFFTIAGCETPSLNFI